MGIEGAPVPRRGQATARQTPQVRSRDLLPFAYGIALGRRSPPALRADRRNRPMVVLMMQRALERHHHQLVRSLVYTASAE
jgi:hypothetical protein